MHWFAGLRHGASLGSDERLGCRLWHGGGGATLAAKPKKRQKKEPQNRADLPPTEKMIAFANAGGQVLGKVVAAGMFLGTGAEVFHLGPELIDPTRAVDIFAGLAGYYGIPFFWNHRSIGRTR